MRVDIEQAISILQSGKVVAFPTETVYGLGGVAHSKQAVDTIYDIKRRPHDNPLICHFASAGQIKQYASQIPDYWDVLVSHFSPGPISYLLPCAKDSPLAPAICNLPTMICRIPNHPLSLQLLEQLNEPVAGPSANPSGQPSSTSAAMVEHYFGDDMPVIDGGSSFIGLESTIVDCTQEEKITVLRPGQIGVSDIEYVLKRAGYHIPVYIKDHYDASVTPGSKYRHYSPQTLIYRIQERNAIHDRVDIALIGPTEVLEQITTAAVTHRIDLGSIYTPAIIAHNLYHKLHELDALGVRHAYLIMWKLGDSSIEHALENRLSKIGETKQD